MPLNLKSRMVPCITGAEATAEKTRVRLVLQRHLGGASEEMSNRIGNMEDS